MVCRSDPESVKEPLTADYFWALSELIDGAKEVRSCAPRRSGVLMAVDHDSRLVAVSRASSK